MNLYERLIGEFIFLMILLLVITLISKSKSLKNVKNILIFYVIALGLMSFFYKPVTSVDLVRLQNILHNTYSKIILVELIESIKSANITNFSTAIYFYLVAKIGIYDLLQTGASLIFYSIIFYIIYDYSKNNNMSYKLIAGCVAFFMLNGQFVELISGIRTLVGFSIFALCIYREFIKGKSILSDILLYVVAIGFHNAIVPLFIIRIFYFLIQKENKVLKKILNIIVFLILLFVIYRFGAPYIESAINRSNLYLTNDLYVQKWEYIASFIRVILLSFIVFSCNTKNLSIDLKNYKLFIIILLIFDSAFFYEYTIFHRYSIFISIAIIPFVLLFLKNNESRSRFSLSLNKLAYYILLLLIVALCFTRGNMTELAF